MKMEEKRAEALSNFLTADAERAKELLSMEPADALVAINAEGYDFTIEELSEFGAEVRRVSALEGEISEENLEQVAGGVAAVITIAFIGTVCFAVGQRIGKYAPW